MALYQLETTVMTTRDMAIALDQHAAQNPLALLDQTAEGIRDAMTRAASVTYGSDEYNALMTAAWDGVSALQMHGVRQHQGFQNAVALSAGLAEQIRALVDQLVNENAPPSEWNEAVSVFAQRIEDETNDKALDLAEQNFAGSISSEFDIDEADAMVFIGALVGRVYPKTRDVLSRMLPQLTAMYETLDGGG